VATGCCYRRWDKIKAALTIYKSTYKGPPGTYNLKAC
jgi:hypothetical protein